MKWPGVGEGGKKVKGPLRLNIYSNIVFVSVLHESWHVFNPHILLPLLKPLANIPSYTEI
jgi:hypothetical protein